MYDVSRKFTTMYGHFNHSSGTLAECLDEECYLVKEYQSVFFARSEYTRSDKLQEVSGNDVSAGMSQLIICADCVIDLW